MKLKIGDWLIPCGPDKEWRKPIKLLAYDSVENSWVCRIEDEQTSSFVWKTRDIIAQLRTGELRVCDNQIPPGEIEL